MVVTACGSLYAGLKAVFGWRVRADPTLLGGSVDLAPAALLYDAS